MIVTSYSPAIKQSPATMSAIADSYGVHCHVPNTISASSAPFSNSSREMREVQTSADILDHDTLIAYVHCFIKNFVSSTTITTAAIDDKIEQAMILVSQHIRTNVNKELMDLKQKISVLLERISQLESENNYLRSHATEETLRSLDAASGDGRR